MVRQCLTPDRSEFSCPRCSTVTREPDHIARLYCPKCEQTVEEMRSEPVTIFQHLAPHTPLKRSDCFSLAMMTLFDRNDPKGVLVHGWVSDSFNPNRKILHAWCEFTVTGVWVDDEGREVRAPCVVVVDHTQIDPDLRLYPRHLIYPAMGVCEDPAPKCYTLYQAIETGLAHGHDGPWPIVQTVERKYTP